MYENQPSVQQLLHLPTLDSSQNPIILTNKILKERNIAVGGLSLEEAIMKIPFEDQFFIASFIAFRLAEKGKDVPQNIQDLYHAALCDIQEKQMDRPYRKIETITDLNSPIHPSQAVKKIYDTQIPDTKMMYNGNIFRVLLDPTVKFSPEQKIKLGLKMVLELRIAKQIPIPSGFENTLLAYNTYIQQRLQHQPHTNKIVPQPTNSHESESAVVTPEIKEKVERIIHILKTEGLVVLDGVDIPLPPSMRRVDKYFAAGIVKGVSLKYTFQDMSKIEELLNSGKKINNQVWFTLQQLVLETRNYIHVDAEQKLHTIKDRQYFAMFHTNADEVLISSDWEGYVGKDGRRVTTKGIRIEKFDDDVFHNDPWFCCSYVMPLNRDNPAYADAVNFAFALPEEYESLFRSIDIKRYSQLPNMILMGMFPDYIPYGKRHRATELYVLDYGNASKITNIEPYCVPFDPPLER